MLDSKWSWRILGEVLQRLDANNTRVIDVIIIIGILSIEKPIEMRCG